MIREFQSSLRSRLPRFLASGAALLAAGLGAATANAAIIAETITPFHEVLNPGQTYTINYKFSSTGATSTSYKVFLHVVDSNGVIRLQDDHYPTTPTTQWSDVNVSPIPDVSYTRTLTIPSNLASGNYKILVGLYSGSTRLQLTPGQRVTEYCPGCKSYTVADLVVTTRQIISASFPCDNIYSDPQTWQDNTSALRSFLASITSGASPATAPIYKLPIGGCNRTYANV